MRTAEFLAKIGYNTATTGFGQEGTPWSTGKRRPRNEQTANTCPGSAGRVHGRLVFSFGLGGTAGSDVHSTQGLGKCVTIFDGDVKSEADLIEALKAKAFTPAQGLHLGRLQRFVNERNMGS
ncbi:MAG: hypothetical protein IIC83_13420 [Chloroflexi bacterium]|nr:hypothetical protein [Chloroflexota bacterium]